MPVPRTTSASQFSRSSSSRFSESGSTDSEELPRRFEATGPDAWAESVPHLGRVDILLVDDQPENLLALEVALSCLGQNLVQVNSGEEALKRVLRQEFAVIILDVVMPGMDGFETAELLRRRERSRDIPIIFLTARNYDEKEVLRGYAMGAVDYIVKPCDADILRSKVSFFVDLFNKTRQLRWQAQLLAQVMERERAVAASLAERAKELARSNLELEQFAYVTSHDLQEPLRVVANYAQLFARKYQGKLDTDADEFLSYIVQGAAHMQAMIQDLLSYSSVGKSDEKWVPVDLNEVVSSVQATLRPAVQEAGASLSVGPLPTIAGQRAQLIGLFQNLLENAIKFRGDASPVIEVSAERTGRRWQFTVRDNGIGIEPLHFDKIFLMFRRLHTREQYPGTGLGLAIARKIVEHHGGRIWVESALGQGSSFKFTLATNMARVSQDLGGWNETQVNSGPELEAVEPEQRS